MLISVLAGDVVKDLPDSGATALLLGVAVIGLGFVSRFVKNKNK